MMTLREIESAMARVLKAPEVSVVHYARNLKEAGPDYWPQPGRGRYRRIDLAAKPLFNLVLAFIGGEAIDAIATVNALRSMRLEDTLDNDGRQELYGGSMTVPVERLGIVIYPTFGETIDTYVTTLTTDAGNQKPDLQVQMMVVDTIWQARITIIAGDDRYTARFTSFDAKAPEQPLRQIATITRETCFWPALFRMLADILIKTASDKRELPDASPSQSMRTTMDAEVTAVAAAPPVTTADDGQIPSEPDTPTTRHNEGYRTESGKAISRKSRRLAVPQSKERLGKEMMPHADRAPLSALPRDLIEKTGQHGALTYRRAYNLAVDGVLPAVELVGSRWFYRPSQIHEIAAALGLHVSTPKSA